MRSPARPLHALQRSDRVKLNWFKSRIVSGNLQFCFIYFVELLKEYCKRCVICCMCTAADEASSQFAPPAPCPVATLLSCSSPITHDMTTQIQDPRGQRRQCVQTLCRAGYALHFLLRQAAICRPVSMFQFSTVSSAFPVLERKLVDNAICQIAADFHPSPAELTTPFCHAVQRGS